MITFQPTVDLLTSAQITFDNMRSYYEHYLVDWDFSTIRQQIEALENWDILYNNIVVGAIRIEYDNQGCYLRDLQVDTKFQNKGIGAAALIKAEHLASNKGLSQLRLRVFKISPAHQLYKRVGFMLDKEDDRFYYMSKNTLSRNGNRTTKPEA